MIRAGALSLLLATQAAAWEFTPGQPCVLTHAFYSEVANEDIFVKLTYDPMAPLYTLSIARSGDFVPDRYFSMTFLLGVRPIRIETQNHQLSPDLKTLTVTDTGFGNVLDGMQFNQTATASLGSQNIEIPLTGAAEPVAAFRACDATAPSV